MTGYMHREGWGGLSILPRIRDQSYNPNLPPLDHQVSQCTDRLSDTANGGGIVLD